MNINIPYYLKFKTPSNLKRTPHFKSGPGSVVSVATGYGLDGPGIEYRWGGRDFPHLSRLALGPTQPLYPRVFPGGKERPGRDADPSPLSSAVVMKGYSYTSTPPVGRTACTEPQCLYKGALYLTSVPVQGCTLPYYTLKQDFQGKEWMIIGQK